MIHNFFSVPIYTTQASDKEFNDILTEFNSSVNIDDLNFQQPNDWTMKVDTTFDTTKCFIQQYNLRTLFDFISTHFTNYINKVEQQFYNYTLQTSWLNRNRTTQGQEFHQHFPHHISGIFYLSYPAGGGELIFKSPNPYSFFFPQKPIDLNNSINIEIEPSNGLLVLFPSWLEHGVRFNQSTDDRLSIAFNFDK